MLTAVILAGTLALPYQITETHLTYVRIQGGGICYTARMPSCVATHVRIDIKARCTSGWLRDARRADSLLWSAWVELAPVTLKAANDVMAEHFQAICGGSA